MTDIVSNRERDAHPSTITPEEFGRAMARLDLSSVPPHLRPLAIREHMTRIMAGSIVNPTVRYDLAKAATVLFRRK